MIRRPWPIVILALLQILSPLMDFYCGWEIFHLNPIEYLAFLWQNGTWQLLINLIFVAPLAAFSIFSIKRWSYPVFLGALTWISLSNYQIWQYHPKIVPLPLMILIYVINLITVSYFLLKEVQILYYNPRVRWWESAPRYFLNHPAELQVQSWTHPHKHTLQSCLIVDFSRGGGRIQTQRKLKIGNYLTLYFQCFDRKFEFHAEILHVISQDKNQYGIQWIIPWSERSQIIQLIKALELLGIPRRPKKIFWIMSFFLWLKNLFLRGKGLVPDVTPPDLLSEQKTDTSTETFFQPWPPDKKDGSPS